MSTDKDMTLLEIIRRYSMDDEAREYFERTRWPNGPVCPHCGNSDKIYARTSNTKTGTRKGLYKCGECSGTFTVTVGTVMEASKVPLHKWLLGFYIMCASKTQVSALQLQRQLELGSYHTAHFLFHRILFALKDSFPVGSLGGEVEADETCIGGKVKGKGRGYKGNKTAMVSLIKRDGQVRSTVAKRVNSKRSLDGTHHNVSPQHLHLYAAELDFKYNTRKEIDGERTRLGIGRIEGKRLMYCPKAFG